MLSIIKVGHSVKEGGIRQIIMIQFLQEEDVLDMLNECDEYEKEGKYPNGGRGIPRGPKVS